METPKIRVNEKNRVVRAYKEDMEDDVIFNKIEKYKKLGYKPIITDRPKKNRHHLKDDMITYLENKIDKKLYDEFIDRVEKQEKFLVTKWWLEDELQKKTKMKPQGKLTVIEQIINQAKSQKNNVIEKAKERATIENESKKNVRDKNAGNEDE